jgi:(p)ppGpp synthase/HD superfamily hydrolase
MSFSSFQKSIYSAINLAMAVHVDQSDKLGMPYILHPLRVMLAVVGDGIDTAIAAVLHDTAEDTNLTLDQIEVDFGFHVRETVDALTRRKSEGYREYIRRVKLHPAATLIKIADLTDNLSRTDKLPIKEKSRLRAKYGRAMKELKS